MIELGKKRPERDLVENAYKDNPRRKAYEIAEEVGLIEVLGYDKAVTYVRKVKKDMKIKGQITAGAYATDEERLEDITTLFSLRSEEPTSKKTCLMLLLNCYYRLRSEDDSIHMMAIDDTYAKARSLKEPIMMSEAIKICEAALAQYMNSKDDAMNESAKKRGYPGAGLNYSDERFIDALGITEEELQHMKSIKRG